MRKKIHCHSEFIIPHFLHIRNHVPAKKMQIYGQIFGVSVGIAVEYRRQVCYT